MSNQIPAGSVTHHAVEAVKHLWMMAGTITGTPDRAAGLTGSISRDAQEARRERDDESFWHFSAAALAYANIAATAVMNTLSNHDNRPDVGKAAADLIDDDLEEANHQVTMATGNWFRAAESNGRLWETVRSVSAVADHPSGFDCTRNVSRSAAWFHCAVDVRQQAPCFNCPSVRKLGTLICGTDMESAMRHILELSGGGERQEPDLGRLGPLPEPEGPTTHCLRAIQQMDQLARAFEHGSDNHRGVAYAALATASAAETLRHLGLYVDMDDDVVELRAQIDRIAAAILSGAPAGDDGEVALPDDYDECIHQRAMSTDRATYLCAPPESPDNWAPGDFGHDDPCRICPLGPQIPERAMDRTLRLLAELPADR